MTIEARPEEQVFHISDRPPAFFLLAPSAGEEAGPAVKGSLDTQANRI
jgi:hypothetical protein